MTVSAACSSAPRETSTASTSNLVGAACSTNDDCAFGEYCVTPAGACGATGTCATRPIAVLCVNLFDPQCGCDGVTYGNACLAAKAGAAVDHDGPCAADADGGAECDSDAP